MPTDDAGVATRVMAGLRAHPHSWSSEKVAEAAFKDADALLARAESGKS
jgi:hypothetical protein